MAKTVTLLQGLPASGKSTWCREQLEQFPGRYKVVNKDALRDMLDGGKWSKHNEQFILKVRDMLILSGLEDGCHVLVDDTNLAAKHLVRITALVHGKASVAVQDFTWVDVEECIRRDLIRPNSVGERVIRQMWRQFLYKPPEPPVYDETLPNAIVYDLDGTTALHNGRNPYEASAAMNDLPNVPVISVIRSFIGTGMCFIAVSGRQECDRQVTENWLVKHAVPFDALFMRETGDKRPDNVIKREIYDREIAGRYNVHFVLDDRDRTVAVWRELGLPCFQVAEGDF